MSCGLPHHNRLTPNKTPHFSGHTTSMMIETLVGCRACQRLNPTRVLLEMISTITFPNMPRSVPGQLLTLVGYSSVLPKNH